MPNTAQSKGISLVERIRGDILSARLAPGTKLTVKMLSDVYHCGGSPVREALNRLTSEGLVDRIDRRGFFVAGISPDEFADILWNRCFLEAEALERSIRLGGPDWEEAVLIAHYRLANLPQSVSDTEGPRPNPGWEMAHKRFHMALLSACGSRILLEACDRLQELNTRYRHFARTAPGRVRSIDGEHRRICDLALARRIPEAVAALGDHYRRTGEAMLQARIDTSARARPDTTRATRSPEPQGAFSR